MDRISELPEPILHHILSFLPTETVTNTSLLSRRWRYQWASVPILNFNSLIRSEHKKLMELVDNFLLHRDQNMSIEKLRLLFPHDDCEEEEAGHPLLENLFLISSGKLKHIKISSQQLKCFALGGFVNTLGVDMTTPNLVYFKYGGYMRSINSTNAPNLLEASIRFDHHRSYGTHWYLKLRNFLQMFNHLRVLTVSPCDDEALSFLKN